MKKLEKPPSGGFFHGSRRDFLLRVSLGGGGALLAGCASLPASEEGAKRAGTGGSGWEDASAIGASPAGLQSPAWEHYKLPGKKPVQFTPVRVDGREALQATAVSAASAMRKRVRVEPHALGRLRFSWKVPHLVDEADIGLKEADDAPVRVVLAFEGDRSHFSPRDALLSELTRALTGEELPYATLMYVWCNRRPAGTVVPNPRTSRIRKLVLESGAGSLGRWLEYERDIRADFRQAFGEEPGALVGIAVMTDSDNTRSTARAFYGPLRHLASSPHGAQ